MKVCRLVLENYRRHRRTDLEWPDGVIAIVGRNGSGKSTLLEALAFALYGPAAARTAKELLRHAEAGPGEPVRVEAELDVAGRAVRIVRELRGKNLTPQAELHIDGIVHVAGGGGSSDAATQAITQLLGMGHKAFITTVVARQKELSRLADESPADRKRLLLEMLGVDQIDRAIADARARRTDAEKQVAAMRGLLADEATLAKAVDDALAEQQAWQDAQGAREQAWTEATARLAAAQAEHEQRQEAVRERARLAAAAQQTAQAAAAAAAQQRAVQTRLADAAQAAAAAAALGDTATRLRAAQEAVDAGRAAHAAARRRQDAAAAIQQAEAEAAALERRLGQMAMPAVPDVAAARAAEDAARAAHADARTALAAAEQRAQAATARLARLEALGPEAPCPTCERPLHTHLPSILEPARREAEQAQQAQQAAREAERQAHQAAAAHSTARQKEETDAAAAHAAQAARSTVEARLLDARERAAAARQALPSPVEAPPLEPLEAAARDAQQAHERALGLAALAALRPQLEDEARAAAAAVDAAQTAKREADAALSTVADPAPQAQAAKEALAAAAAAERAAERAVLESRHRLELAVQQLAQARRRQEEEGARRGQVKSLEEEAVYWGALAGPRGGGLLDRFKDHIVQRIGPAIGAEAGRLLAAFTGGRYTEVVLDDEHRVFVADGGSRYTLERFSGGESDLVHLALRLAVSRLLADRAGAAEIRFLALDEVFGSLDAERRADVVAALRGLGGLYSQVLLVTHLESLQDALDSLVEVQEKDGSSLVTVYAG